MKLKIQRLSKNVKMPRFAHDGDACFDLSILMDRENPPMTRLDNGDFVDIDVSNWAFPEMGDAYGISIEPNGTVIFHTGLKFETERGYNMKIHVRSSTGIKKNLILSNGTGVVDTATYRGEVLIALTNIGATSASVTNGERVAQAEIVKTLDVEIEEVDSLSETERGEGGFGSTGGH